MERLTSFALFQPMLMLGLIILLSFQQMIAQTSFTDVTESAGIDHIFEVFQGTFGGGAAVIDYDLDGWEDVFIASGEGQDQLLKNMGNGTFVNVSIETGMGALDGLVSQGAAVADVNRDGWPDLFVTIIAKVIQDRFESAANVLLINNGDGTFSNQTFSYGLDAANFSTSASFGDVNKDGYPDLYVCNYFEDFNGKLDQYSGPIANGDATPGKDLLYINQGGERFIEVSEAYGIQRPGLTFQALWTDFDNDRDLDILVANDFGGRTTPNLMYRNDFPETKFTEVGRELRLDYGINGMGIGATDFNMDGFMDYVVTNIQVSPFHISRAGAPFTEQSVERGTGFPNIQTEQGVRVVQVSWGVNFFDTNHDTDQDLYITNGCLNPVLAPHPNLLLENLGDRFQLSEVSDLVADPSIGRGSVVFDYDRDGDLDLLVVNQEAYQDEDVGVEFKGTRLFRNENSTPFRWLQVKLNGRKSETHGIGSRVEIYVEGFRFIREIYGGSSHESQNTTIAHFGLARFPKVDSLIVKWAGGSTQKLYDVEANQVLEVTEEEEREGSPVSNLNLRVFPSLFTERLSINFQYEEFSDHQITVLDTKGRKVDVIVERGSGNAGSYRWEVPSSLSPGMYLILMQTTEGFYYSKAIKRE